MKNILVAIDFSENEVVLLEKAFQFAEKFKSKIWLMHIAAPRPDPIGYEGGSQYIRDFRAKELRNEHRLIQEHAKQLKERGIETDGFLISGGTIEMIIEESIKLNIDLIMIGHHKHSLLYKLFTGSTAGKIVRRSNLPVLIVPFD